MDIPASYYIYTYGHYQCNKVLRDEIYNSEQSSSSKTPTQSSNKIPLGL